MNFRYSNSWTVLVTQFVKKHLIKIYSFAVWFTVQIFQARLFEMNLNGC